MRPRLGRLGDRRDELRQLLLRRGTGGGNGADALADGMEHLAEDLLVERRLAVEVVVDHRLVDVRGAGDAVDVGAGEAARGELGGGSREQPLAAADSRAPCLRRPWRFTILLGLVMYKWLVNLTNHIVNMNDVSVNSGFATRSWGFGATEK